MAAYQIVKVRMETSYAGSTHEHIGAVLLSDGQQLTRSQVILNIRRGVQFYTYANGYRARVYERVCHRCRQSYITTSPDGTTANNLDKLPRF